MAIRVLGPTALVQPSDLFLAGGISNCPNWQDEAIQLLDALDPFLTVANPRRAEGLEKTGDGAAAQIAWEHGMLRAAKAVLFWFPEESVCPITLLEFGVQLERTHQPLVVGAHPNYIRRFDLIEQGRLSRGIPIHDSLKTVVSEAVKTLG